jgi:hypothetical protein
MTESPSASPPIRLNDSVTLSVALPSLAPLSSTRLRRGAGLTLALDDPRSAAMTQRAEDALIDKIRSLPAERLAEVEDFVEFLATKEKRRQAAEELRAAIGRLARTELTDADMQEISEVVKEVRAESRRARP